MADAAIAGLVLAGGRGRRMGDRDKAFLTLGGTRLVDRAVARLGPQVAALAISSNRAPADFAAHGLPVLADRQEGAGGPLAGLHAGLAWASAQRFTHLQTVAVDAPFFPGDLVVRMAAARSGGVVVARSAGRAHPVFALVSTDLATDLDAHLRTGGSLRVADWLASHHPVHVDFDPVDGGDPFFNINTPGDLADAAACMGATHGES